MWHVYILECSDGSLYTGITNDLQRRLAAHMNKKGSRYTRSRNITKLAYSEKKKTRSSALKREAEIKSWPRLKKLTLVEGN